MSSKLTRIAIAGVGTVGTGVLNLLIKNKILENSILIFYLQVEENSTKKNSIDKYKIFDDKELVKFDDYDVLIELIGGEEVFQRKLFLMQYEGKKS